MTERERRRESVVARFVSLGGELLPVVIEGRAIAQTFWGKAWCDNLERYRDFALQAERLDGNLWSVQVNAL